MQDYSGHQKWYTQSYDPKGEEDDMLPVQEVAFGFQGDTRDDHALMVMTWHYNRPTTDLFPTLEVGSEGWAALAQSSHLLYKLGEATGRFVQPDQFCAMLEECGFEEGDPFADDA